MNLSHQTPRPLAFLLAPAIVGVVTFVCFFPAIDAEFLDFDDKLLLLDNSEWRGFARENLEFMFTARRLGNYQPIVWLSYAVDHRFWGLDPAGYHLTNVVLHSVNAILLYFLVCQCQQLLIPSDGRHARALGCATAVVAVLAYAIHPMRVESVAWVAERKDVLSLFFLLIASLAFLAYYRRLLNSEPTRIGFYALAWVGFSLSLLSKPIGMSLPIVFFLLMLYIDYKQQARLESFPSLSAKLLLLAPFLVAALAVAAVAFSDQRSIAVSPLSQGGMLAAGQDSFLQRVILSSYSFCYYLVRTIIPCRLSALYPMPLPFVVYRPEFLLSTAATAVSLLAMLRYWRRYPGIVLAFVFYGLILAPVSGLTHVGIQLVADRYSYHSLIPLVPLLSIGLLELHGSGRLSSFSRLNRLPIWCLFVLVLSALGASTAAYASKWRDQLVLWTWCIHAQPSYGTFFQRASAYLKSGAPELALADAEKVVEYAPRHFNGWLMQAGIHAMRGNRQKALRAANKLVWLDDDTGVGYRERGKIRFAFGMYEEAAGDLAESVLRDPDNVEASVLLGQSHSRRGRHEEAIRALERALELGVKEEEVLPYLAIARFQLGQFDAALEAVAEALELGLRQPDLYLVKGRALLEKGDSAGARDALRAALEEAPSRWSGRSHVELLLQELSD